MSQHNPHAKHEKHAALSTDLTGYVEGGSWLPSKWIGELGAKRGGKHLEKASRRDEEQSGSIHPLPHKAEAAGL